MWVMTFSDLLEQKYLQWQAQQGKRRTLDDFAEYLGVGRPVLSNWLTGKRKPNIESLRLLSNKLGFEVYDVLGLPRPDEDLAYISQHWDEVPEEFRRKFREEVEKQLEHESKRIPKNRRSHASS
jgi:transcriptional regulator with XRE-family HTH domain